MFTLSPFFIDFFRGERAIRELPLQFHDRSFISIEFSHACFEARF